MSSTRDDIFNSVQTLLAEKDVFAASEYVLALADESKIVEAFSHLITDCYYKAKSVEQAIHFGHAGIHYCLARAVARQADDPAAARELRFAAKRMATNLASFTWPGWDEEGVTLTPEQVRQGLAFARYSIRQLHELDPTVVQLGFSYWFLGAQLLANRQYDEAVKAFEKARDYSKEANDNPDGVTMLEGYIGLTKILDGQRDAGEAAFGNAVSALRNRGDKEADFYAEQLVKARAVFESEKRGLA